MFNNSKLYEAFLNKLNFKNESKNKDLEIERSALIRVLNIFVYMLYILKKIRICKFSFFCLQS